MNEALDMPQLVDGDDFSEVRGKRSRKKPIRPSAKSKPTKRGRPTPKRRPKQRRRITQPQKRQGGQSKKPNSAMKKEIKLTPLPLGKKKQGSAKDQPKSNKMLYIVGGIAVLGLIGFLIYKRK